MSTISIGHFLRHKAVSDCRSVIAVGHTQILVFFIVVCFSRNYFVLSANLKTETPTARGRLSQPTVFAFTFLLLIVMNLEQARCNKVTLLLYHSVSQNYLTMHSNGSVTTDEGLTNKQCMELNSITPNPPYKLTIYNPASKMYLCFNRTGILVGKTKLDKNCLFYESFSEQSYTLFEQVKFRHNRNQNQKPRFVAFSKNGRPQRWHKKKKMNAAQFMKMPSYGHCEDSQNETTVPMRHSKHNRGKHKP